MEQDVALAQHAEHAAGDVLQARRRARREGAVLQLRPLQPVQFPQTAQPQRAAGRIHVVGVDLQVAHQDFAHISRHVVVDLQPHGAAEVALAQIVFHHQQQVVGLFLLQLHVAVARHAKRVGGDDLHAREEPVEIGGDDLFGPDELLHRRRRELVGVEALQRHQPRQCRRHLDAGEVEIARLRVAHLHRQVEAQVGDVGERPAGIGGQRRQNREDFTLKVGAQFVALRLAQLLIAQDVDVGLGQLRVQLVAPDGVGLGEELRQRAMDVGQLLARQQPVGRGGCDAQPQLLLQARHAHHEEFVHIAVEDGQKFGPFQQRVFGLRLVQYAAVEFDVAQFAVDVEAGVAQVDGRLFRRLFHRGGLALGLLGLGGVGRCRRFHCGLSQHAHLARQWQVGYSHPICLHRYYT